MVFVGEKKQNSQQPFFGQLPLTENNEYKKLQTTKLYLEEYVEVAIKKKKFSKNKGNTEELQHRVSEIESEISSLFPLFHYFIDLC